MSGKFDWKWPLVWRKTLVREQAESAAALVYERTRADREIEEKSKIIDSLLPKLFKVTVERPAQPFGRFRAAVDFTDEFVYACFTHGDSQEAIRYLAARLAHEIEREILTINFQRMQRGVGR